MTAKKAGEQNGWMQWSWQSCFIAANPISIDAIRLEGKLMDIKF